MADTKYVSAEDIRSAIGFQAESMISAMVLAEGETATQTELFDAMVEALITKRAEYIDAMIGRRIDVSTVTASPVLARIAMALVKYDVYTQYARYDVPETVKTERADAEKQLLAISQGKLDLVEDDAVFVAEDMVPEFTSEARALTVHM
jgi:hypothetical protein